MEKNIQIEKIIHQRLADEGRNITWLCKKLGWQRQKYYRFLYNGNIDINDLYKISLFLNHNFFQYHFHILDNLCNKLNTKV